MWDLARRARLLPPFANTPVRRRPTIAAALHEGSRDVDRRVLAKRIVHCCQCAWRFGLLSGNSLPRRGAPVASDLLVFHTAFDTAPCPTTTTDLSDTIRS